MKHVILLIVAVALVGCASTPYTPGKPYTNTLGMKFVPVPGTEVQFSIWETRVKDYAAYAAANAGVDGRWEKPFGDRFMQTDTHPVVIVSWKDAVAFCVWLTKKELAAGKIKAGQKYRLPTDAEWSVAVGLGKEKGNTPEEKDMGIKDVYPWRTISLERAPPKVAGYYDRRGHYDGSRGGRSFRRGTAPPKGAGNYDGSLKVDNYEYTSPVGSFAANKLGLHDLGGNVWEWCEDKYSPTRSNRVLRGAAWGLNHPDYLLSSCRVGDSPDFCGIYGGFRCVLVGE